MEELYKTLGEAKCEELAKKSWSLWHMLQLGDTRKNTQVRGTVQEGIAKDFIREFLPVGFGLKSGLIFDAKGKETSPQCDAIIYKGVPLLEFTDVVVVERKQVKAIVEIKGQIQRTEIFGRKIKGTKDRNPNSGLAYAFERRKDFLPEEAKYILVAFHLFSSSSDAEVIKRLKGVCDSYAVMIRWTPKKKQKEGEQRHNYNFDNSVSKLIEWLRNLS